MRTDVVKKKTARGFVLFSALIFLGSASQGKVLLPKEIPVFPGATADILKEPPLAHSKTDSRQRLIGRYFTTQPFEKVWAFYQNRLTQKKEWKNPNIKPYKIAEGYFEKEIRPGAFVRIHLMNPVYDPWKTKRNLNLTQIQFFMKEAGH